MNRSRTHEHFDEYLWPLAGVTMSFDWSALEARATEARSPGIDEYLWPLDGLAVSFDWQALQERTEAQQRLAAIYEHVLSTHVQPRPQQRGVGMSVGLPPEMMRGVVEGASGAPLWECRLKAPVPKALRDEWSSLCEVIRGQRPHETAKKTKRTRPH